jgi:hypothetical protein
VRLVAVPARGWTVVRWTAGCSGRRPCALRMTRSRVVAIRFVQVEPPPVVTTTTTTTATTPAEPPPLDGRYCGFTGNSGGICFTVSGGGSELGTSHFAIESDCSTGERYNVVFDSVDTVPVTSKSFDWEITTGEEAGSFVKGTLDTAGNAQGTLHIKSVFDYHGRHFDCLVDTSWTAKLGA